MKKAEAQQRLEELREIIRGHDYQYYVLDNPVISDFDYDRFMQELLALENNFPELVTADSPSQRVGGEPLAEFTAYHHRTPLLSLSNAYDSDDLREFHQKNA